MKYSLLVFSMLVILFSCKKEVTPISSNTKLLSKIKDQLKDSVSGNDFQQLDFNKAVITNCNKGEFTILRIPFLYKNGSSSFVLLKIEKNLSFSVGKIIDLNKNAADNKSNDKLRFNGKVLIYSLSRVLRTNSLITNGYIESFQRSKNINARPLVVPIPYQTLPDAVVVASYSSSGMGWSYSDWLNMQDLLNESNTNTGGGPETGGYYNNITDVNPAGGGGVEQDPIFIDFEPVEDLIPIKVAKYLKCFSAIPDAGATCTIKILSDIPVDTDPTVYFSTQNGSPGHTFLQITKSNGTQFVQQNIGFYPVQGWKVVTTLPSEGKFVDNAGHEFNASLSMELTPDKFQKTLDHIQVLANVIPYDLAKSNCTDFALHVFNYQRGANQLIIPSYSIPVTNAPDGTKTPQALYLKLKAMKENIADPESKNVTIPGVKGFAGNSNGPCN